MAANGQTAVERKADNKDEQEAKKKQERDKELRKLLEEVTPLFLDISDSSAAEIIKEIPKFKYGLLPLLDASNTNSADSMIDRKELGDIQPAISLYIFIGRYVDNSCTPAECDAIKATIAENIKLLCDLLAADRTLNIENVSIESYEYRSHAYRAGQKFITNGKEIKKLLLACKNYPSLLRFEFKALKELSVFSMQSGSGNHEDLYKECVLSYARFIQNNIYLKSFSMMIDVGDKEVCEAFGASLASNKNLEDLSINIFGDNSGNISNGFQSALNNYLPYVINELIGNQFIRKLKLLLSPHPYFNSDVALSIKNALMGSYITELTLFCIPGPIARVFSSVNNAGIIVLEAISTGNTKLESCEFLGFNTPLEYNPGLVQRLEGKLRRLTFISDITKQGLAGMRESFSPIRQLALQPSLEQLRWGFCDRSDVEEEFSDEEEEDEYNCKRECINLIDTLCIESHSLMQIKPRTLVTKRNQGLGVQALKGIQDISSSLLMSYGLPPAVVRIIIQGYIMDDFNYSSTARLLLTQFSRLQKDSLRDVLSDQEVKAAVEAEVARPKAIIFSPTRVNIGGLILEAGTAQAHASVQTFLNIIRAQGQQPAPSPAQNNAQIRQRSTP